MSLKINPVKNIPNVDSTDQEWIIWHSSLKRSYNKKQANLLFLKAWNKRNKDGILFDGKANTVYLREYLEKQGIKVEKGGFSYIADFYDDSIDFFSGIFGTASKLAIGTALIIFLLIVWIIIKVISKPKDYSDLISLAATRGMSAKLK